MGGDTNWSDYNFAEESDYYPHFIDNASGIGGPIYDDQTVYNYESYRMSVDYPNFKISNASNESNATQSSPFKINQTILCGFPGFCRIQAYARCANVTLNNCAQCNVYAGNFLVFFCVVFGLLIVAGNAVVITVCARQKIQDTFGRIKISLAVADLIVGVQVLGLFPYNIVLTMNSTSLQLQARQFGLRGSTQAIIGGFFLLLSFTSSLYHLLYLGGQRLTAIRWPFIYRKQKPRHVVVALCFVWGLAVLTATLPVWFPNELVFTYYHTLFAFFFAQKNFAQANRVAVISALTVFYVLPLIIMTFLCATMAVTAHQKFGSATDDGVQSKERQHVSEKRVYRVVLLMQFGFLITQLPFVVCNGLFYSKVLTCYNWSDPFLFTFYLSIINSLVNVVVYSLADPNFKAGVRKLFGCRTSKQSRISKEKQATHPMLTKSKPPSTGETN